ncbi:MULTISPECIES: 2-hydroxyacid dehydrogenase [unclassified Ruminococcus]|uniref:2-hydroxyacid dehydrogenase n=1 Tax=unclassified Ruminococcus TaxID=2608920 RepID=UPI000336EA26|nr:2-hydroxyacid dehydrogenase [Ruminococcus sp. CAG:330]CDE12924.1 d-lactate dehydrogenase [Ruminococcus sp. CAG:330]
MKKIAFFDAKPYDRTWFDQLNQHYHIKYYEHKLTPDTISLAHGCEAVIPFVNDTLDRTVIDGLCQEGIKMIALRCAGYNNVDRDAARGRIPVVRVPGYSPYAVAEFTMGLLLTLNRKIHKAYFRTRDFNFSLNGLVGFDLHGRTVGVIGTGKIGQIFIRICQGFGMHVLAYDPYPVQDAGFPYVSLEELLAKSDIISLHCPLTEQTRHLINRDTIAQMKDGVYLLNTSRGMLVESESLLDALKNGKIAGAGLDVYEEETEFFFEDRSDTVQRDTLLSLLVSMPNVVLTSHQAFLTNEALHNIAQVTLDNLDAYFKDGTVLNAVQ